MNVASPLEEGVVEQLYLTSQISNWWLNNANNFTLRTRFIGTTTGTFRSVPGSAFSSAYDPTIQPWYLNAISYPRKITLTGPIQSSLFQLSTVSISRTVYLENSQLFGVIGTTLSINYMISILKSEVSSCNTDNKCFLIDVYGNVIINTERNIFSDSNSDQYISIISPDITNILSVNSLFSQSQCIDLRRKMLITHYTIDTTRFGMIQNRFIYNQGNTNFNLTKLNNLDLYLLIVPPNSGLICDPDKTNCRKNSQTMSTNLDCVFINREDLTYIGISNLPLCPVLDTPYLLKNTLNENLPSCYENECKYTTEVECSLNFCVWCEGFNGKASGCPKCISVTDCPNGDISSSIFVNCIGFSYGGIVAIVIIAVVMILVVVAILAYCIKTKRYKGIIPGPTLASTHTKDTSVGVSESYKSTNVGRRNPELSSHDPHGENLPSIVKPSQP